MYFDDHGNEFKTKEDARIFKKKEFDELSFLEKMEAIYEDDRLSINEIANWINAEGLTKSFCKYFADVFKDMKDDHAEYFVEWCLEWEDD